MTGAPAARFGLPRALRLLSAREFRRVYQRGRRQSGRLLTVVGLRVRGDRLRVGLSVSKDNGPAVRRNKIKRLLREAFRLERPDLPTGLDVVLIPRPGEAKLVLAELRAELAACIRRLDAEWREAPAVRPRRGRR